MTPLDHLLPSVLTVRSVVRATLVVLLVVLAFAILYRFHLVFFTLLIGIVLSRPFVPMLG